MKTIRKTRLYKFIQVAYSRRLIELSVFEGCVGVTELNIPQGVLKVIQCPGCRKIKREDIPENVTSIGAMVFMSCVQLNEVILSQGIKGISDGLSENPWLSFIDDHGNKDQRMLVTDS